MPQVYTQVTVYPSIPKDLFSDKELFQLGLAGFDYDDAEEGKLYFYAEDNFTEEDEDEEGEIFNALEIFHSALFRSVDTNNKIDEIVLRGAWTCSKMVDEGFGGFVVRITKEGIESGNTDDILLQMRKGEFNAYGR